MVASQYARLYRTNSILTASPAQLVLMMYDAALGALANARLAFDRPPTDFRRYEAINTNIRKAQRIFAELKGNLDFEVGGDFAPQMDRLYAYYNQRLFDANVRKDAAPVAEVEELVKQIRNAWAEMIRRQGSGGSESAAPVSGAMAAAGAS